MKKIEVTFKDLIYLIQTFEMVISLEEIFKLVIEINKLIDESNNNN